MMSDTEKLRNGTVQSVTGTVQAGDLGVVLTHEHLHMEFDVAYCKSPPYVSYPEDGPKAFSLPHLGTVRQYPYGIMYNLKLNDPACAAVMLDEMLRFKSFGGGTIVENTTHGIDRSLKFMKDLSERSGVNIIAGTGYYVAGAQKGPTLDLSVEKMHDIMVEELVKGVSSEDSIKCGVIGEIGISWPIHDFEKNVIRAVASAQEATGAPVTFHPGRNPESPFEIIRIFAEAGGKSEDVIMSHLERTIFDDEKLLEFAQLKTFTQFDLFGTECSYYQIQPEVKMPSDAQRIDRLHTLKENGHLSQILMSHDLHTKHRLASYGGHGYSHILQNIVPVMKNRGFTEEDVHTILVQNPKRWLCGPSV